MMLSISENMGLAYITPEMNENCKSSESYSDLFASMIRLFYMENKPKYENTILFWQYGVTIGRASGCEVLLESGGSVIVWFPSFVMHSVMCTKLEIPLDILPAK